jgi:hypothetical protein
LNSGKLLNLLENRPERRGRARHQSSKRVHDGEPIILVPDFLYLIDFTTRAKDILSRAIR